MAGYGRAQPGCSSTADRFGNSPCHLSAKWQEELSSADWGPPWRANSSRCTGRGKPGLPGTWERSDSTAGPKRRSSLTLQRGSPRVSASAEGCRWSADHFLHRAGCSHSEYLTTPAQMRGDARLFSAHAQCRSGGTRWDSCPPPRTCPGRGRCVFPIRSMALFSGKSRSPVSPQALTPFLLSRQTFPPSLMGATIQPCCVDSLRAQAVKAGHGPNRQ